MHNPTSPTTICTPTKHRSIFLVRQKSQMSTAQEKPMRFVAHAGLEMQKGESLECVMGVSSAPDHSALTRHAPVTESFSRLVKTTKEPAQAKTSPAHKIPPRSTSPRLSPCTSAIDPLGPVSPKARVETQKSALILPVPQCSSYAGCFFVPRGYRFCKAENLLVLPSNHPLSNFFVYLYPVFRGCAVVIQCLRVCSLRPDWRVDRIGFVVRAH